MRINLHNIVLGLAAVWLAASFMPPGMVVCAQSTGVVETGLTCPCPACQSCCEEDVLAEQAGCCGQALPNAGIGERCCTCTKLPPLSIAAQQNLDQPRVTLVAAAGLIPLASVPLRLSSRASVNFTQANPPPLLKRSVVLLI